ncbi:T9SS type A sorting domain-containing protein [Carboxylicivirga marina]|uniref:T9SS type A sorting domain-containing protein n=1 Tax=Carboxylicivirga marina TaxID=2800988 RepID=A0ABS1HFP1_9BACT|nr:T9SS type A sorting domain-containing protein [Carboxylicivirga marina]MBK3516482.1 T9SS type A sorting domain-containing protein [Carboxylicivirga marina]
MSKLILKYLFSTISAFILLGLVANAQSTDYDFYSSLEEEPIPKIYEGEPAGALAQLKSTSTFVEIGEFSGWSNGMIPLNQHSDCTLSQTIYFQSEINVRNKRIKSLYYYVVGEENWSNTTEIYMGHTKATELERGLLPAENFTRVFKGEISTSTPTGWLKIDLTYPFEYNNTDNLVIAWVDNDQINIVPSYFYLTATGENDLGPLLSFRDFGVSPRPFGTHEEGGRPWNSRPDVRIEFEDIPARPILQYTPEKLDIVYFSDIGEIPTETTKQHSFDLKNLGNTAVTINGLEFDELQDEYAYDGGNITIAPGQTESIPISFTPSARGDYYTNVKLITDIPVDGDSTIVLRSTVYPRGHLYQGWEHTTIEDFPGNHWTFSENDIPFEEVLNNWRLGYDDYPEAFSYDRYNLLMTVYTDYVDTLITPALDIQAGGMDSITFYGRSHSYGNSSMPIVISKDKENWSLLEEIEFEEWDLLGAYPQDRFKRYSINFPDSIVGKHYIGFVSKGNMAYLDKIEGPKLFISDADLLIASLEADNALALDKDNVFTLTIENLGLPVGYSDYTIQLFDANSPDVPIKEMPGEAIDILSKVSVDFIWHPTVEGAYDIFFKILLTGDEQPENNLSEIVPVNVYDGNLEGYEVNGGEDESDVYYPMNFNFMVNLAQGIYFPDELSFGKTEIYEMNFEVDVDGFVPGQKFKVWIGETEKESLEDGMIPASELTLVYESDSIDFQPGKQTIRVPFKEPYQYTGKNLVFMLHKQMVKSWYSGLTEYKVSHTPERANRSVSYLARYEDADPYNPPSGKLVWNPNETTYQQHFLSYYMDATFFFNKEGLGVVDGKVTDVEGVAIEGVKITERASTIKAISDESGFYQFDYLNEGPTTFNAIKFGYSDLSNDVFVAGNYYQNVDLIMHQRPKYEVIGRLVDFRNQPINEALITLNGYDLYTGSTGVDGVFFDDSDTSNIKAYSSTQPYVLRIEKYGYEDYYDTIAIEDAAINLGDIQLTEITGHNAEVKASVAATGEDMNINWTSPKPALAHYFRYDSGLLHDEPNYIGYTSSDKALIGNAFKNEALITDIEFYLYDSKRTESLKIFILGLNSIGAPDKDNILYESDSINVITNDWNKFTLETAVYAENGFFVGFNCAGFLGLGKCQNTEEYPFQKKSNYLSANVDDREFIGHFFPLELDLKTPNENFMVRANGYNYGSLSYDFLPSTENKSLVQQTMLKSATQLKAGEVDSYTLYRFSNEHINNPELWTLVAENLTDTFYVDAEWNNLSRGSYRYAIESKFNTGHQSFKRKSNIVGKDMSRELEINVTLPDKMLNEATMVKLTRTDIFNGESVVLNGASSQLRTNLWRGSFKLEVTHPNCVKYIENIDLNASEGTFIKDVTLENALYAPVNVDAKVSSNNSIDLMWESYPSDTIQYDDGSVEYGFFFLPGNIGEFGNRYHTDTPIVIKELLVYSYEHLYTLSGNKVTARIYNAQHELLAESASFELSLNGWTTVSMPNVKVYDTYYVMVSWDDFIKPTALLALDANGSLAHENEAAVVKDEMNFFKEFGSVGGRSGAFLIRPIALSGAEDLKSNSLKSITTDHDREGVEYLAPVFLEHEASIRATEPKPKTMLKSTIETYHVYQDDMSIPYYSDLIGKGFSFDNINAQQYTLGVSQVNPWGESDIAAITVEFDGSKSDATLESFSLDGVKYAGFAPDKFNYIIGVDDHVNVYPSVTAIAKDYEGATVTITGGDTEEYVNIHVLAQDKLTSNTYSILFTKKTGVEDTQLDNIKVYPNPAKGMVYIENAGACNVEVFNMSGVVVLKRKVSDRGEINLSSYAEGVYFIHFTDAYGHTTVKRLVNLK